MSFLDGIGSIIDIAGVRFDPLKIVERQQQELALRGDAEQIAGDWRRVGRDLVNAAKQFHETNDRTR